MRTSVIVVVVLLVTGCTVFGKGAPDAVERDRQHCERLGHARGSEGFRACVETEDINAQRAYERKLIRRIDCVDPRIACDLAR